MNKTRREANRRKVYAWRQRKRAERAAHVAAGGIVLELWLEAAAARALARLTAEPQWTARRAIESALLNEADSLK